MKNKKRCVILISCVLLASITVGCDDKDAQSLAGQLAEVAKSYQEQAIRTTKAEQTAYRKLAAIYVHADRADMIQSLAQERLERGGVFADDVTHVKKAPPLLSEVQSQLRDYADLDFKNMQLLMQEESEANAEYLAQLEKLNVDTKRIQTLVKSFEGLSKRKPQLQQLKETVSFWQETKKEVDKQYCRDLARDIAALEESIKALEAQIQALPPVPTGATSEAATKQLKTSTLNARLAAQKSELEVLNGQKTVKKCSQILAEQ